ncbi:hypothetical protein GPECTOR_1g554 [Gonium pectorale]|uniref:Peptide deformylase n=1 Tax=Gonium pectorale TaxID=33097 RepID=A0A150H3K8_GONPE|nr:hypothetical protein GPECTOR_1g554 [Gonium pectorale]|eukprot:KXZ56615.1 hypothetical protein GPECTOR_1g554 [Gonium pectorale]
MANSDDLPAAAVQTPAMAHNPIRVAREVPPNQFGSVWLRDLVDTMVDVMRAAPGVGLAAPQIGEPWRVIVLEDREEYISRQAQSGLYDDATLAALERAPFAPLALVNPVVLPVGQSGAAFFEGCLSVRGYTAVVPRYREVYVDAVDPGGRPGVLYVDRMLPRSLAASDNLAEWVRSLPADLPPLGPCTCCHRIDRAAG